MVMSVDLRFPDGKAKALTLSYDDGVEYDIRLRQHRAIRNGALARAFPVILHKNPCL